MEENVIDCYFMPLSWLSYIYWLIYFKGALAGLRQFLGAESPWEMMKNGFIFTSKPRVILKIFTFLSWLFGQVAKRLDKNDKVNFKFHDVTAWLTNNCNTHIRNIWRSKGYQKMKFGQLMTCNLRNIFLEKSYTKCDGETSPRSFSEKLKLRISLYQ